MNPRVPPQLPSRIPTRLAFIGEAPSDDEVDQGKPLVGPSGRVFNALLRSAGLTRTEYLVTNLFDEEVPNDEAVQIWGAGGVLVERNRERLIAELALTRPTVVVPMGSPALFAFTGSRSIMQARGAVMRATEVAPNMKLVPTYHPAYVMRQWQMFPVVIGDMIRASQEADRGPQIIHPERRLSVDPTLDDLRDWTERLTSSSLLSVDIETALGQITCIGFAPNSTEALVVPFVDRRNPDRSYWPSVAAEVEAWLWVRQVLEHPVPKLGQNFSGYDLWWLYDKHGIMVKNLKHDTRLIHHALYAELPKSLAFMGASYGTQGAWKHWGHKGGLKKDD